MKIVIKWDKIMANVCKWLHLNFSINLSKVFLSNENKLSNNNQLIGIWNYKVTSKMVNAHCTGLKMRIMPCLSVVTDRFVWISSRFFIWFLPESSWFLHRIGDVDDIVSVCCEDAGGKQTLTSPLKEGFKNPSHGKCPWLGYPPPPPPPITESSRPKS